jgi:phosphoadenosine phosphosulfate reductase
LVSFALQRFSPRIAIASSFGAEDVVLIHLAAQVRPDFRVFTLDTDFLFPATYALIDDLERRYRIKVERTRPRLTPEEQAREFGAALWSREPDQCCNLRKVEPLTKKLSELDAWVTGIRRDQAPTRANARKLDWDAKFGLVKINPLADWKWEQVWEYIRFHEVPYNPLHDQSYPSIGCTYCTRPVQAGEDPRAGRWSGFQKTECGLHAKG